MVRRFALSLLIVAITIVAIALILVFVNLFCQFGFGELLPDFPPILGMVPSVLLNAVLLWPTKRRRFHESVGNIDESIPICVCACDNRDCGNCPCERLR